MKRILFSALLTATLSAFSAERPNLLFIMVDDLGYGHCQFHNDDLTVEQMEPFFKERVAQTQEYTPEQALELSKKAMPTLTSLAEGGAYFTRAYAASSLCAPSRLAVATGKIPPAAGVFTNMDVESDGIKPGEHLAHKLHDAGYATAHIGKWHVGKRDQNIIQDTLARHGIKKTIWWGELAGQYPEIWNEAWEAGYYGSVVPEQNPLSNGFDYYYGYNNWASQFYDSPLVWENFKHAGRQSGYNTEVFTDKTLDFIKKQDGKPFYVQLHYHAVHDYLEPNAPKKYWKGMNSPSYNLSNFYAHVNAIDQNIKRILDHLESTGQLENTLIAFTSDNGAMSGEANVLPGNAPFTGHKGMFRQGGIRVPLLFYWPKEIKPQGELKQLASSMDIIPTFIDAAGLDTPKNIDAKSLYNILSDKDAKEVHERLIWSGIHANAWGFNRHRSLVGKNVERNKAPGGWAILQGDHVLRFTGTMEAGVYRDFPDGAPAKTELFNVSKDPTETSNLIDQQPEIAETLKSEYLKRAQHFPEPVVWNKDKWEELVK